MTDLSIDSIQTWRTQTALTTGINLEWYRHMKCRIRFCDIEKIRRQQMKEEKREGSSYKTVTSTEDPNVEVEPIEPRLLQYAAAMRQNFSTEDAIGN